MREHTSEDTRVLCLEAKAVFAKGEGGGILELADLRRASSITTLARARLRTYLVCMPLSSRVICRPTDVHEYT